MATFPNHLVCKHKSLSVVLRQRVSEPATRLRLLPRMLSSVAILTMLGPCSDNTARIVKYESVSADYELPI